MLRPTFFVDKAPATNSAVPTLSRPVQTNSGVNNGTNFAARPLKHYRKQLIPTAGSAFGRAGIGMPMDLPGGTTALGTSTPLNTVTCVKDNVLQNAPCDLQGVKPCPRQFIRSASSILKKNYYTDSRAYLRSRCQLYEQKLTSNPVPGIQYVGPTGQALYPTDSFTGPQTRYTQNCANNCGAVQGPITEMSAALTIHKPSNRPFYYQGAVDASLQNVRLIVNDKKVLNPPVPLQEKNWPLLKSLRGSTIHS